MPVAVGFDFALLRSTLDRWEFDERVVGFLRD